MKRNRFLQSMLAGSAILANPISTLASFSEEELSEYMYAAAGKSNGSMIGFKSEPIKKVRIGMIGLGNRGKTLTEMLFWMIQNESAEIIAIGDLLEKNVNYVLEQLKPVQKTVPVTYYKDENDWQNLVNRDDLDLLVICTPWHMHAAMAIYGMEQGKHVAAEVPIAYTMKDCWSIVKNADETKK